MNAPISIVIPAFNQLEYCRKCVSSIIENTVRDYHLILVDNGSTDGVGAYFDSIPGASVVHAKTNLGFSGGVNLGLRQAQGHVVLLNSDTLTPRGWLARLEEALLQSDDIGMVGPMSNYVSGAQQIDGLLFASLNDISAYADELASQKSGDLTDTERLVGFCMLVRDVVIEHVGLFDERFGIGNFEDDDYCLRVRKAGFRLCIAEDCFVFHYGSRTFAGMGLVGEQWKALLTDNERRFVEKWNAQSPEYQQAKELNDSARAALERNDANEALRLLAEAVQLAPAEALHHNDLGAVLWRVGEHERAYECFSRAVRLRSDYAEARENLRDAAKSLGRPE